MISRHFMRCVAMVLGLAIMTACGGPQEAGSETGVLYRGNSAEPSTLDPQKVQGVDEMRITTDLFMGLMTPGADGRPQLGVAESMEVSEDGRVYRFVLREDARWSDGEALTADDVVFSFRRLMAPEAASPYAALFYDIENAKAITQGVMPPERLGVSADGPRGVVFQLEHPAPYFLQILSMAPASLVPRHMVEAQGAAWVRERPLVSNGAYRLLDWVPQEAVRLKRNPAFHDSGAVEIDAVTYLPTDDRAAAVRRFEAGEIQMNSGVPLPQMGFVKEHMGEALRIAPVLQTTYLAFNTRRAPFNDVRVRTALAMVIQRDIIGEEVLAGLYRPAQGFVPPQTAGHKAPALPDWMAWDLDARREAARALLREAGYGPQNPLRFEYRVWSGEDHRRKSIAIASNWKAVGVEASLIQGDLKSHLAALRSGAFALADAGWTADFNDAVNFLFLFDGGTQRLNYSGYSNVAYDDLLGAARLEADGQRRAGMLAVAESLLLADMPVFPLFHGTARHLVSPRIEGFEDNPVNIHPSRFLRWRK